VRDDGPAGADPDPHLQQQRRILLVQLTDRPGCEVRRGADGALGIVLLRDWDAEDGHPAAAVQK
jgi:hypothetical protein